MLKLPSAPAPLAYLEKIRPNIRDLAKHFPLNLDSFRRNARWTLAKEVIPGLINAAQRDANQPTKVAFLTDHLVDPLYQAGLKLLITNPKLAPDHFHRLILERHHVVHGYKNR